jgi:hypothetical protein
MQGKWTLTSEWVAPSAHICMGGCATCTLVLATSWLVLDWEELPCCWGPHLSGVRCMLSHSCLISMLASAQSPTYSCLDRLMAASTSVDGSSCDNYQVL